MDQCDWPVDVYICHKRMIPIGPQQIAGLRFMSVSPCRQSLRCQNILGMLTQKNIICHLCCNFYIWSPDKWPLPVCLSVIMLKNWWPLNIEYGRYLIKLYSWFQMLEGWLLVLMVAGPLGCWGTRPRGVRVELATFYNPNHDFSCLGRRLDSYNKYWSAEFFPRLKIFAYSKIQTVKTRENDQMIID